MTDQDRIAQLEAQVASLVRTVSELVGLLAAKPAQPAVVQTVNPFYVPQPIPFIPYYPPPAPIYPPVYPLYQPPWWQHTITVSGADFVAPVGITVSGADFVAPVGNGCGAGAVNVGQTYIGPYNTGCATSMWSSQSVIASAFVIDNTGSPQ